MIVRIAVKVKNPPVLPGLNVLCEVMMYPAGVAQVRNLHSEIRTHLVTGVWLLHLHCNNKLNILNQSIMPVESEYKSRVKNQTSQTFKLLSYHIAVFRIWIRIGCGTK